MRISWLAASAKLVLVVVISLSSSQWQSDLKPGPAPKGLKNLAQGLPWVFGLKIEALKGRPLTRCQGTSLEMPVAPSGLLTLGAFRRANPG